MGEEEVNAEEIKQYLESRRKSLSEQGFFNLVFDMLENTATKETREILESYMVAYSHVDEDRVAHYLAQFLAKPDPHVLAFVLPELGKLAKRSDSLAEKILEEFSEEGIRQVKIISEGLSLEPTKIEEELEQNLKEQEKKLSEKEFFELIVGMLEKNPPEETREILKKYLMINALIDEDRVARYLEQFLSDSDSMERELAARDLAFLAHKPNSLAYKILTDYLGEEPTADNKWKILNSRLVDLFPHHSEDDQ